MAQVVREPSLFGPDLVGRDCRRNGTRARLIPRRDAAGLGCLHDTQHPTSTEAGKEHLVLLRFDDELLPARPGLQGRVAGGACHTANRPATSSSLSRILILDQPDLLCAVPLLESPSESPCTSICSRSLGFAGDDVRPPAAAAKVFPDISVETGRLAFRNSMANAAV